MIDYSRLREDDPGGSIPHAFAWLSKITDSIPVDSIFITVASVSAAHGMGEAEAIHKRMLHFSESNIPPPDTPEADLPKDPYPTEEYYFPDWLIDAFGPFGNGFDIGSATTRSAISTANSKGVFTPDQTLMLLRMNITSVLRYPGLTHGDMDFVRNG